MTFPAPTARFPDGIRMVGGCLHGQIIKRPHGMCIECGGHQWEGGSITRHVWQYRYVGALELVGAGCTSYETLPRGVRDG